MRSEWRQEGTWARRDLRGGKKGGGNLEGDLRKMERRSHVGGHIGRYQKPLKEKGPKGKNVGGAKKIFMGKNTNFSYGREN